MTLADSYPNDSSKQSDSTVKKDNTPNAVNTNASQPNQEQDINIVIKDLQKTLHEEFTNFRKYGLKYGGRKFLAGRDWHKHGMSLSISSYGAFFDKYIRIKNERSNWKTVLSSRKAVHIKKLDIKELKKEYSNEKKAFKIQKKKLEKELSKELRQSSGKLTKGINKIKAQISKIGKDETKSQRNFISQWKKDAKRIKLLRKIRSQEHIKLNLRWARKIYGLTGIYTGISNIKEMFRPSKKDKNPIDFVERLFKSTFKGLPEIYSGLKTVSKLKMFANTKAAKSFLALGSKFGKVGKFATRASRYLGPAGEVLSFGFDVYDAFNATSEKERNKKLASAAGGAIGAALGSFIPIPVVGSMIGYAAGSFVGKLIADPKGTIKEIKDFGKKALKLGSTLKTNITSWFKKNKDTPLGAMAKGALAGTAAIPIPVLGATVGAAAGLGIHFLKKTIAGNKGINKFMNNTNQWLKKTSGQLFKKVLDSSKYTSFGLVVNKNMTSMLVNALGLSNKKSHKTDSMNKIKIPGGYNNPAALNYAGVTPKNTANYPNTIDHMNNIVAELNKVLQNKVISHTVNYA